MLTLQGPPASLAAAVYLRAGDRAGVACLPPQDASLPPVWLVSAVSALHCLVGVDLDLLHRHVGVSVELEITNCTSCAR
jgi:hypothetical protein